LLGNQGGLNGYHPPWNAMGNIPTSGEID